MYRAEMGSIALIVDDDMTTSIEVGISETYVEVIGKEKIAKMVAKIQDAVEVCAILRSRSCKVLPYVIS